MPSSPLSGNVSQPTRIIRPRTKGLTQLSLVEHALCPLDAAQSLRRNFVHETNYFFTDANRNRKRADVQVYCPAGLSAADEFYLWGLLAITLSQPNATSQLSATPHFCLRQLGCIDSNRGKGGNTYDSFRQAIMRLAAVHYQNNRFYDPIRGEHRDVGFGFFSYSLPLNEDSSRAWRFHWDPIFFEICQASASALVFDLTTYRDLEGASRRLYLLVKKIFWRNDSTPEFEVRHLAVNVLGFAPTLDTWKLKQKLVSTIQALIDHDILCLPPGVGSPAELFRKSGVGEHHVRLYRGSHFDQASPATHADNSESPFHDQLKAIGFDEPSIHRILQRYDGRLIAEWSDITLAAKEKQGDTFFTNSPQAYFSDNIKHAAAGTRTPPDWWREMRLREERLRKDNAPSADDHVKPVFDEYLRTEARESFEQIMMRLFTDLQSNGMSEQEARQNATRIARMNLRAKFHQEHPEHRDHD
jgi:hypothetical protein